MYMYIVHMCMLYMYTRSIYYLLHGCSAKAGPRVTTQAPLKRHTLGGGARVER